jgi:flagellar biogenesis protein FliO
LIRKILLCLGIIGASAFGLLAQTPPPSPAEKELQQPLALDDVKPTQGQAPRNEPSGWRAFGSTLVVVGLAGGGLWAFRKYGIKKFPGSGGSRLKVEESLALGDRRFVSILRADEERFLIALTPQGITLLARMDGVETPPPESFGKALEHHVELTRPTSVREVEAMMKAERP